METYPEAWIKLHPDDTAAVFEIFIKTTPERLWEAITDPELRREVQLRRRHAVRLERPAPCVPRPAFRESSRSPRARTSRSTRRAAWSRPSRRSGATRSSRRAPSRVTWDIEPVGESCRLTVTHDQLNKGAQRRAVRGLADVILCPA